MKLKINKCLTNKAVVFQDCGASISVGSVFADLTNPRSKIFFKVLYCLVYIVRPMMIASMLNIYRFSFCHYSLNSIVRQLFVTLTLYKEAT